MSNLSKETIERIEADSVKLYPLIASHTHTDGPRAGYKKGALREAEMAQGLIDLLDEARIQIEYLHKKFGETGSGNNVLSRIETELAKYKEVSNG
jgi:hypothetical protein